jgi:membrane-bound lytic murein transglycosylase B
VALTAAVAAPAHEALDPAKEIAPFAREVASAHGLDPDRVAETLRGARVLPKVLEAMRRPAEAKPWRDYRPIFLTDRRIEEGVAFWKRHGALIERAQERFGVSARVIVAIIGVETFYGARAGSIRVLDALATLGFRYPRRAEFFRRELGHYLVLTGQEGLDVTSVQGSYAGAMGIPQFIPSSYREYAVDFDGNGRRDLIASVADAVGSVGSYLARHGWVREGAIAAPARVRGDVSSLLDRGVKPHSGLDALAKGGVTPSVPVTDAGRAALIRLEGRDGDEFWLGFDNFYVITRYNRSELYAMAVFQLAEAIAARRSGGG